MEVRVIPHITTCTERGCGYEELSEETANNPKERLCYSCWEDKRNYLDDDNGQRLIWATTKMAASFR